MTTPCPNCVETRQKTIEEVADWLVARNAVLSGTAINIRRHFLPKSPAQQLAEECPHGMTEEQAQWVLERAEKIVHDAITTHCLTGGRQSAGDYSAAACKALAGLTTPTDCPSCHGLNTSCQEGCGRDPVTGELDGSTLTPADAAGFRFTDDFHESCKERYEAVKSDAAPRERNIPHADGSREYHLVDPAPRYVFGPWVEVSGLCRLPKGSNFQYKNRPDQPGINTVYGGNWSKDSTIRRAYRLNQSYPHDGGESPLADGGVRVRYVTETGVFEDLAVNIQWWTVTSFTPLDQGEGQ